MMFAFSFIAEMEVVDARAPLKLGANASIEDGAEAIKATVNVERRIWYKTGEKLEMSFYLSCVL
jgi:hypothetical protein